MEVLLFLVIVQALMFSVFCAAVAGIKRKNSVKWLGLGFLFGFIALLVLIGTPGETSASSSS